MWVALMLNGAMSATDELPAARVEQMRRYREKLERDLGPDVRQALSDPNVIEVMLNPDGKLWVERVGSGMTAVSRISAQAAERLIATVAAGVGTTVTYDNPTIECELPTDGSRFAAMIFPAARAPMFTIRRHAALVWSLDDYVRDAILTAAQADILRGAIVNRDNILVAGGTGSGKTTLTNALINEVAILTPAHRLVIIEDTPEIQCQSPNAVSFRANAAIPSLTMERLLARSLRHRPDRIIVGEVRGGEALTLIEAWNTGHPGGIATIHANEASADDALFRLESLVAKAARGDMRRFIAKAVNLIAVISREGGWRRVKQLIRVEDFLDGAYRTKGE